MTLACCACCWCCSSIILWTAALTRSSLVRVVGSVAVAVLRLRKECLRKARLQQVRARKPVNVVVTLANMVVTLLIDCCRSFHELMFFVFSFEAILSLRCTTCWDTMRIGVCFHCQLGSRVIGNHVNNHTSFGTTAICLSCPPNIAVMMLQLFPSLPITLLSNSTTQTHDATKARTKGDCWCVVWCSHLTSPIGILLPFRTDCNTVTKTCERKRGDVRPSIAATWNHVVHVWPHIITTTTTTTTQHILFLVVPHKKLVPVE